RPWPCSSPAGRLPERPTRESGQNAQTARSIVRRRSEDGQVTPQLELGDRAAVVAPLRPLVAQEEVEDVLAERLGDQLAPLHDADRLVERLRQRLDAQRAPLGAGERPHVVLGGRRQLVALLDALEPG